MLRLICNLGSTLFKKYWKKADLPLQFDYIVHANRVGPSPFTANRSNHFQVWVVDYCSMNVICVRRSNTKFR
jgi:hypothetical protein